MNLRTLAALLALIGFAGIYSDTALAQESGSSAALSSKDAADLDAVIESADAQKALISNLNMLREQVGERGERILDIRLDRAWAELTEEAHDLAARVSELEAKGVDTGKYRDNALATVEFVPDGARKSISRILGRLKPPDREASATDQAAADAISFDDSRLIDQFFSALVRNVELAEEFGIDVSAEQERIRDELGARALSLSITLELTQEEIARLKAAQSLKPDDADIAAMRAVVDRRSDFVAGQLDRSVGLLERLGVEAPEYKAQVVAATGEVSTDILDPEVAFNLIGGWLANIGDWFIESGPSLLLKLLLFVGIILVFRVLARVAQRVVTKALDASGVQVSQLLRRMIISVARSIVMIFGVLVALSQLGISVGPVLAGLGVAGFVIGFALQDTLSNFASGMMILLYRPFDVGDVVETGTVFGTVKDMSLVNTTFLTFDNQTMVVPNSKIWGDVIKNVTAQTVRRVDMMFGIGYADDIPRAEAILEDIVHGHDKVMKDPAPVVKLHELADSSVNFIVRPWVRRDDYWDVYWSITRDVKMRFDAEGVSIPFPQQDIHVYTENKAPPAEAPASSNSNASSAPDRRAMLAAQDADSPDAPDGDSDGDDGR
jgi:small conductance mechanosensitive channel